MSYLLITLHPDIQSFKYHGFRALDIELLITIQNEDARPGGIADVSATSKLSLAGGKRLIDAISGDVFQKCLVAVFDLLYRHKHNVLAEINVHSRG